MLCYFSGFIAYITLTCIICYTGISNRTLPRYKTEAKMLKEKTEEEACSETAIKFSIG